MRASPGRGTDTPGHGILTSGADGVNRASGHGRQAETLREDLVDHDRRQKAQVHLWTNQVSAVAGTDQSER
ncbi:hypothetical protein [Streptomyces dysideae]|nr:hypothetical protein [Streptomyces dysideae]